MQRLALAFAALTLSLGLWQVAAGLYIPAKAWLAHHLIAHAWATAQAETSAQIPWPWADTHPVAKISVSRLGIERYVLAGASGRTLAFGPGHLDGTALPGEDGVAIVGGHRDTHLRFLKDLIIGDEISVQRPDRGVLRYQVQAMDIVHKDRARVALDVRRPHLVLFTCYPFDDWQPGGPLRYAVTTAAID